MKKHKPIEVAVEPSLSDRISTHPALEWIYQNRKNVGWALIAVLAAGVMLYQTLGNWSRRSGQNYIAAENAYLEMRSTSGEVSQGAAEHLQLLLMQQPDLQARYDGLMAQFLLIRDERAEALPIAQRALTRTQGENSPYFSRYADNTLAIADGSYRQALTDSITLQQEIISDPLLATSSLLPLNLLRIAMLQQKLELEEDELNSWSQWRDLAKEEDKASHFQKVTQLYSEGEIDLQNYIAQRLNHLN